MRRNRAVPKFSGKLAEPIYEPGSIGLLALPDDETKRQDRIFAQLFEKLHLLFDHYKINRDDEHAWVLLSLRLAIDLVPGLTVVDSPPSKPGRRRIWQAGMGHELLLAIDAMRRERQLSIRSAINELRRSAPSTWGRFTRQNLETRRREANRARKKMRLGIIAALTGPDEPMSLARLAAAYHASQTIAGSARRPTGLLGAIEPPPEPPPQEQTDEK